MNKRTYLQPQLHIVRIHQAQMLCGSSPVSSVNSNLTGDDAINYGGGSSGPARARSYGGADWEEW